MSNEKWRDYTQEFDFTPDAEEIKNIRIFWIGRTLVLIFHRLLDVQYRCS